MAEIIKQTKRSTMEVADQGAKETSLPVPDPPSSDSVYTDMLHSPSWPRLTDEPFIAPPPSNLRILQKTMILLATCQRSTTQGQQWQSQQSLWLKLPIHWLVIRLVNGWPARTLQNTSNLIYGCTGCQLMAGKTMRLPAVSFGGSRPTLKACIRHLLSKSIPNMSGCFLTHTSMLSMTSCTSLQRTGWQNWQSSFRE